MDLATLYLKMALIDFDEDLVCHFMALHHTHHPPL